MKSCITCTRTKKPDAFYKHHSVCKMCISIRRKLDRKYKKRVKVGPVAAAKAHLEWERQLARTRLSGACMLLHVMGHAYRLPLPPLEEDSDEADRDIRSP